MRITVNGEDRELAEGATVQRLLEELRLRPEATVVERNGEIVDRTSYGDAVLLQNDVLELIRFVGGG